jgi:hypothetical protein
VDEDDIPELLARRFPCAAGTLLFNLQEFLRSSAFQPHRCKVWRDRAGKWSWECREAWCDGDTWLSTQRAAFAAAFGHASGMLGPYPYQRPVPVIEGLMSGYMREED